MYGKFFSSTFSGSMLGAGPDVFSVWAYTIANTVNGLVELNPILLSAVIGMPVDRVEKAIGYLCSPDPNSRNPDQEGRRILKQGQYQYKVVSHEIYRAIRNEDERRLYNAQKQRESRAKKKMSMIVNDSQSKSTLSAHTEAEAETETNKDLPSPSARATASPVEEKPKKKKRTRDPLPLNRIGGEVLECFEEAKACWPNEITGWNDRLRSNETRKVAIGNIQTAQKFFLQLVEEGHATAQELYACAWVASNKWKREGYLWVPHLSTFYGPEKEVWAQYLQEAKRVIQEADKDQEHHEVVG